MGDAPNELEVLEARREILQLEIALAQERRAAAEAEQKGKKAAEEGGEPTLDYVVPASYPDARHAESLPTAGIPRRGMLKLGAWEEIDGGAAHCVNRVHLVPKVGSKKFRLVIDLRPLNLFCGEATGVARAAGSGRPPGGSRDPPAASPLRLLARIHSCCWLLASQTT